MANGNSKLETGAPQALRYGQPETGRVACQELARCDAELAAFYLAAADRWAAIGDGERVRYYLCQADTALRVALDRCQGAIRAVDREIKLADKAAKRKGRK